MKYIVTHGGAVHRDDLLATSIALSLAEYSAVYRRDPTPAELGDSEVLVLDVGGVYDPALHNFDHHQMPRGTEECALSLFAKSANIGGVEPLHDILSVSEWYRYTILLDSQGPTVAAKAMGLHRDGKPLPTHALISPVEGVIEDWFRQETEIKSGTMLFRLLSEMGRDIFGKSLALYTRLEKLTSMIRVVGVKTRGGEEVPGLFLPETELLGLSKWREMNAPGAAFSISYDDRGEGLALFRYEDDPRIDFSRIKDSTAVLFAHVGGFIAKTHKRLPLSDALGLVAASLVR